MLRLFSEEIASAEFLSSANRAQFVGNKSQRIKPFYGVKDFALDDTRFLKILISQCCRKRVGAARGILRLGHQRETHVSPAAQQPSGAFQELSPFLPVFCLFQDKNSCSLQ